MMDFQEEQLYGHLKIKVKLEGTDKLVQLMKMLDGAVKDAGMDGLVMVQETIMSESFPEVPKKDGHLEGSAFANDPVMDDKGITISQGYNIIYAVRQHEELEWYHPIKGKSKYLEDPAMRVSPRIPDILRPYIERSLKRVARGG